MALSFIGKTISLISHSDVRYRGVLAGIDPAQSTIQLSQVYSMGTENRRTGEHWIPPVPTPYDYIIFRASEVKDISVDEPVPVQNIHSDPAVLGASAPPGAAPFSQPPQTQPGPSQRPLPPGPANAASAPIPPRRQPSGSVQTATASMESVERAMSDLRVGATAEAPARRTPSNANGAPKEAFKVPTQDFDFAGNNARFEKSRGTAKSPTLEDGDVSSSADSAAETPEEKAYNPTRSFFDTLAPATRAPPAERGGRGGGGGGRGGRGMGGRSRRDEERDKNVATFGEPGGIGLMGPGAYVGGYGRRGGGRGRRGPGAGRQGQAAR